jgi:hypothetical protein
MSTGEPDARKAGTSGSEGGRRKRTSTTGTSSAAYPTSRPDQWGRAGEIPARYPAAAIQSRDEPGGYPCTAQVGSGIQAA